MSQNVTLTHQTLARLPTIKHGLIQKWSEERIAQECKVTRRTIIRDIQAWIKTDDFYEWLHQLWLHLYSTLDDNQLVFREVSRLIGRGMTQKIQAETKITGPIEIKWAKENDSANNDSIHPTQGTKPVSPEPSKVPNA